MRLLELMREHNKAWALYVFSSANALKLYTMEELVGLGISWVWMGLEGLNSQYSKLKGTDSRDLVRSLQQHGIRVLGSSIIGLEEHTPENIGAAIEHAVSHASEFHQFMLYTPAPGTPLHAELSARGVMLGPDEIDPADVHGQYRFNYRHPNIPPGDETEMLLRAFRRDFEVNGPSVLRVIRTTLTGWRRYRNHPEPRIRERFAWEIEGLATTMAGAVWAARRDLAANSKVRALLDDTLAQLYKEFGLKARVSAVTLGPIILHLLRREQRRLAAGHTYEPPTFYDANPAAVAAGSRAAGRIASVVAGV
jgi:hypothetical protein